MSLEAMREAEEAVPVISGGMHEDRIVTTSDPEGTAYQTVTVHYDTCMSSGQLADARATEGLQLSGIHQTDEDGVRVRFRYYLEGGEQ
jgi:hypothetical protein